MRATVAALALTGLIALLMAATAAPPSTAQQAATSWSRSTWILLPAVVESPSGLSGTVVNVTVTLSYPGTGAVIVHNGTGLVSGSTLYSMEMAYLVAMTYAGLNWESYNLTVYMNYTGPVTGPSGSFGVMLATYALASGLNASALHKYAITGAVSPSGLAGPIGGLQYKCEAASARDVGIVFPVGDLASGLTYCRSVRAVPVAGIVNASHSILGAYNVTLTVEAPVISSFDDIMREVAEEFIGNSTALQRLVSQDLAAIRGNPSLYSVVASYLNASRTDVGYAESYLASLPYAAASYAFTAYVNSLAANLTLWAYRAYARGASVSQLFYSINSTIATEASELLEMLQNMTKSTSSLVAYEMMATAAARLADAMYYAQYAAETSSLVSGNASEVYLPAYYAALGEARIASAMGWIRAAEAVEDLPPLVSPDLVRATSYMLAKYTNVSVSYADSLINYYASQLEEVGGGVVAQELLGMESDLNYLLSMGLSLYNESKYVDSIGVFDDALTNALDVIFIEQTQSFNLTPVISAYERELVSEYNLIAVALAKRGLFSPLDLQYILYAQTLTRSDPQDAIYIMEAAVIDELGWYLGSLGLSQATPTSLTVTQTVSLTTSAGSLVTTTALVLVSIALGAAIAAGVAAWSYRRSAGGA